MKRSPIKRGTSTLKRTPFKRSAPKRRANKQERAHMSAQADAGCILCRYLGYGNTPAEIHHLRHSMGAGQRNSDLMTIPLCPEHHRGRTGFHGMGRRAFEREYGVTELDLLAMSQKNNPASVAADPGLHSHLTLGVHAND